MRHLGQAIAQVEESIQRNQALVVQHRSDPPRQGRAHLLPVRALLLRPRKQFDQPILRDVRLARCCLHHRAQ
jgi:hypothetical protein